MLNSMTLKDYMLPDPVRVRAEDDLSQAIRLIVQHRVSGLCVVDQEDHLVGVLSEMDCLKAIVAATYHDSGARAKVRDHMTTEVQTCGPEDHVVDVASDMLRKGQRRRPVVEDRKLVGQITCRQLLRVVIAYQG
ncbi:MAG TPA: CBS domain-containing protein [Hydrogenophaga sp.]|uniref:CBS domain-containing protein n=1 Tax=Hydrogenophaga sp. TaxID=1904254 RepID=UPI002CCEB47F|nr:CBS domain-containing protein [Hydrogenophaga sp.]HMN93714.1 CBS domain-containing protein [Hydrogenophaga sp.]HMP09169.1 CBS domain-containing protein [Hydrogenophaga sp.]